MPHPLVAPRARAVTRAALVLALVLLLQPGCYLTRRVWQNRYGASADEQEAEPRPLAAKIVTVLAKSLLSPFVLAVDLLLFPAEAWLYVALTAIPGRDSPLSARAPWEAS